MFHCTNDRFQVPFIEIWTWDFFNAEIGDNHVIINGKSLIIQDFLSTGKRTAINDNPPVCCCSNSDELFNGSPDPRKTGPVPESFICQAAGRSV